MISLHSIFTIAKYERKTLLRSWFFRIFAILSILILFIANISLVSDGGDSRWIFSAIPSSIPYFNLLILNVAQAIIAVFLASDFMKRDKKLDTTEVVYMRSMSNAEYVIGKTLGNIQVFIALNGIVLLLALIFNFLAPGAAINWISYILYLVLISIPTLIFIMGLSFLLMSILKNQAVTFVLILSYIGITLFLLQAKYYYLLDYMAFNIPMLKSEIIGFGNLDVILIHRGIYLFLGLGFILMSTYLLQRLPQSEVLTYVSLSFSILFIVAGMYLGYTHFNRFRNEEILRKDVIALNSQFADNTMLDVTDQNINLKHTGKKIEVSTTMEMKNTTNSDVREVIMHLNPGLEVTSVGVNGNNISFEREKHLIIFSSPEIVTPENEINVTIEYNGKIDEAICYLDIDEETREENFSELIINSDKRYAFLTPDYVLLTPEANWYPKPGVSYTPDNVGWNKENFINFNLNVETSESLVAISQGQSTQNIAGNYSFTPEQPLSQISLTIGRYENKSFTQNNVTYGLWYLEGHDYFSNILTDVSDTVKGLIADRFDNFQQGFDLSYSFPRISLIEVPAQFKTFERLWTSNQESIQPEQILIQEKGYKLRDSDFRFMLKRQKRYQRRNEEGMTEEQYQIAVLNNFLASFTSSEERGNRSMIMIGGMSGNFSMSDEKNPYYIFPQLFNFQNNFHSEEWPVLNRIFEAYLGNESSGDMRSMFGSGESENQDANIALLDYSFEELLNDPDQKEIIDNLISLKGEVFFALIQSVAGEEEFIAFLKNLLDETKFRTVRFEEFEERIYESFGIELQSFMEKWFNERNLPKYLVSAMDAEIVQADEQEKTMVRFKISNMSEVEGVVKISFRLSTSGGMAGQFGGRGGGGFGGFGGGSNVDEQVDKIIYLEGNQTKEISYLLPGEPRMASVNTLTSQNIPQTLSYPFMRIQENERAIPQEYERVTDIPVNLLEPNEVIVDNEDPEFKVTENNYTNLLQRIIIKEDENEAKYSGVNMFRPPTQWTATTNSDFYGEFIRSAYYIQAGDGSQTATWDVPLIGEGFYEVYYYVYNAPNFRGGRGGRGFRGNSGSQDYNFTITNSGEEEEVVIDMGEADEGWYYMGSYNFIGDTAVIQLSNKSGSTTVYADAVKLIKL